MFLNIFKTLFQFSTTTFNLNLVASPLLLGKNIFYVI